VRTERRWSTFLLAADCRDYSVIILMIWRINSFRYVCICEWVCSGNGKSLELISVL
jgi:hypothetical protein